MSLMLHHNVVSSKPAPVSSTPVLLPFPAAGRVMNADTTIILGRTVVISCNQPGSVFAPLWQMLDGNNATFFNYGGTYPLDIVIDFGGLEPLSNVGIKADQNNFGQAGNLLLTPPNFELAGSTDNSAYTNFATVSNAVWTAAERKQFALGSVTDYRFIRLRILPVQPPQSLVPYIAEMDFS